MANAKNSASGRDGRRHNVPPEHGKIRAKEVRNPWGRAGKPSPQPPTAIDDLLWLEANRIVSHDSNGPVDAKKRLIQEEFFAALKGGDSSVRARLLAQLQDSGKRIEAQSQEIRDFFLKGKALLTEQFYLAQRTGRAPPDVLPHPDHVSILGGEILFHGPTDLRGRLAWETIKSAIRITACIHQVTKEEFRRTADPLALEQLKCIEKHRRWLMRAVPKAKHSAQSRWRRSKLSSLLATQAEKWRRLRRRRRTSESRCFASP